MTNESGQFIAWKGHTWKRMRSRTADSYSDAHRLRRKNYMRQYRANKKARVVETDTREEGENVSTVVTSVTTL